MCARCILSTIPRMHCMIYMQHTHTRTHAHAHSFAIHRLSPERGAPPRVVICRACNDREGRDSLEAAWDMPFLIRSRCKPERSCPPSLPAVIHPTWSVHPRFFSCFPIISFALVDFSAIRNPIDSYICYFVIYRYDQRRWSAAANWSISGRSQITDVKLLTITNCDLSANL